MSVTEKALWVIERHLDRALTLADLAEACGVSRYHLAHAFGRAAGIPVMQYLRARRLTAAAMALASGAPDILGVALDTGYASHEAFSRAFRAQFGVTPEMVRRRATTEDIALTNPIAMRASTPVQLSPPRFVTSAAIFAVGLAKRHPFDNPQDIPSQWQAFMSGYAAIPHKRDAAPVGISGGMDENGNFEYIAAAEVAKFGVTPKGLIEIALAPQTYAVFLHDGHVSQIGATYEAIWNEGLPATGRRAADACCVERHLPGFDPKTGMGAVELWIPVVE